MGNMQSFPKVIPFNEDWSISIDELTKHCIDGELLKELNSPSIKFVAYNNHELILQSSFATGDYKLMLKVSDKKLLASCSCADRKPGICIHICKSVAAIIGNYGSLYFSQLDKNRQFDLAFKYPLSFDKVESNYGISVTKRKELMQLFPFENSTYPMPLSDALALKIPNDCNIPEKREAIAFFVMLPYSRRQLPFVLPVLGKMTKCNDGIISWRKFLIALDTVTERLINTCQLELIGNSYLLREKSESLAKYNGYCREANWNEKVIDVYNDWQKIFPLLQSEIFIYSYTYFGERELRKRPSKSDAHVLSVSMDKPVIYFKMEYVKDRLQLSLGIKINGKKISSFNVQNPFFLIHQRTMYMFNTYQDAAIVQWIANVGYISFFKEHKKEIDSEIIEPLAQKYTIV